MRTVNGINRGHVARRERIACGRFFSSLAIFLCGAGIVACFAVAAPDPLTFGTPHWQDFAAIVAAGLLGMLVGGIGLALSVE